MCTFQIARLLSEQEESGQSYLEFLRVPALSAGLYALPAGGVDGQEPHTEDEVYYVLKGRGLIRIDGEDHPVEPGTLVFVAARAPHRFHAIAERLELLVLFAPAEGSSGAEGGSGPA